MLWIFLEVGLALGLVLTVLWALRSPAATDEANTPPAISNSQDTPQ